MADNIVSFIAMVDKIVAMKSHYTVSEQEVVDQVETTYYGNKQLTKLEEAVVDMMYEKAMHMEAYFHDISDETDINFL